MLNITSYPACGFRKQKHQVKSQDKGRVKINRSWVAGKNRTTQRLFDSKIDVVVCLAM